MTEPHVCQKQYFVNPMENATLSKLNLNSLLLIKLILGQMPVLQRQGTVILKSSIFSLVHYQIATEPYVCEIQMG